MHLPVSSGARLNRTGIDVLDHELAQEVASALGHAGRRAEECLNRLAHHKGSRVERDKLLRQAASAVHAYFIQREVCGLRKHDDVVRSLAIPKAVLVRLGACE